MSKKETAQGGKSEEGIKLLCQKTSPIRTIGRNGILDPETQTAYWAEWMCYLKGLKVYFRRVPGDNQRAWFFKASDNQFLGVANCF